MLTPGKSIGTSTVRSTCCRMKSTESSEICFILLRHLLDGDRVAIKVVYVTIHRIGNHVIRQMIFETGEVFTYGRQFYEYIVHSTPSSLV